MFTGVQADVGVSGSDVKDHCPACAGPDAVASVADCPYNHSILFQRHQICVVYTLFCHSSGICCMQW